MRNLGLAAAFTLSALSAPAFGEDLVFDLINDSSYALQELYVSPASMDEWGDDVLGVDILAAGEQGTVTIADGMTTCAYDLRFVTDAGNEVTGSADLCETHSFTLHD